MSEDLVWHQVHPVTPVVKGWKVLLVLLVVAWQSMGEWSADLPGLVRTVGWWPVVGVLLAAILVGFAGAWLAWRMTRYAIGPDAVYLHTGVLARRQRTARLDRVQGIDVVQPLLARLLGLAELRIEVAGGADSAVRLSFLREDAAHQLRNTILARAAGVDFGTPEQPEAPEAPERELVAVTPARLVASLVRSPVIGFLTLGLIALAVTVAVTRELGVLFSAAPAVLGAGGYLWGRFAGEFNFRLAQSPDGIRLRHGLLEQRAQTVPPGRVQAVRLRQPVLWRGKDWWRLHVNVAGYGVAEEDGSTQSVLLPVGDRREALLALWLVLPDLGVQDPQGVLDAALSGTGEQAGFVTSPHRARWLDPLAWRRTGYLVTERALLARRGWFQRELVVVPHERTQSLGLTQGPLQRRLDLATVALHSTPGPISPRVPHLASHVAADLVAAQAARARQARAGAGPERWMRGVGPAPAPAPTPAPPPPPASLPLAGPGSEPSR